MQHNQVSLMADVCGYCSRKLGVGGSVNSNSVAHAV